MCDRTGSQDSYGTGILGKEIIPQYSNLVFLPIFFCFDLITDGSFTQDFILKILKTRTSGRSAPLVLVPVPHTQMLVTTLDVSHNT